MVHSRNLWTATLGVALAAAGWSLAIVLSGGIDVRPAGLPIVARTPWPTTIAAAVLAAVCIALRRAAVIDDTARIVGGLRRGALPIALGIALATGAAAVRFGTFAVGGSDSNCYVEQAERWAAGTMLAPVAPGFAADWPNASLSLTPTGFVPSRLVEGAIAPICPSGLSLIMAAPRVLGAPRTSVFYVVPAFAATAIFCVFLLGCRLAGPLAGLVAALLSAASPVFLYQSVQPMSDVPATALWLAALACLAGAAAPPPGLKPRRSGVVAGHAGRPSTPATIAAGEQAWAVSMTAHAVGGGSPGGDGVNPEDRPSGRGHSGWLAGAGLASGAAVLVRPNLAPLVLVIVGSAAACGAVTRRGRDVQGHASGSGDDMGWLARAGLVSIALVPAAIAVGVVQSVLYGSPFSSGYGTPGLLFRLEHVPANLARFPRWLVETQSPLVVLGFVAPFLVWITSRSRARSQPVAAGLHVRRAWLAVTLWLFTLGAFAAYLPYVPFDGWWFLRFWLPGILPLIVLAVGSIAAIAEWAVRRAHVRRGSDSPMRGGRDGLTPGPESPGRVAQGLSAAHERPTEVDPPLVAGPAAVSRIQGLNTALVVAGLLAGVGLSAWQLGVARDRLAFQLARLERKFIVSGQYVATLPAEAVVLTIWHSGAVNYYAARPIVMWDALPAEGLDTVVDSLQKQGREVFLLMEPWEEQGFTSRFGKSSGLARLDWPARARFGNEATLWAVADRDRFLRGEATVSERVWVQ